MSPFSSGVAPLGGQLVRGVVLATAGLPHWVHGVRGRVDDEHAAVADVGGEELAVFQQVGVSG
jgi:hypothetical protein